MNEDAPLIEAALRGDSAAFGELVRRYQNRLLNAVLPLVGDRTAAEDVVQDAFVQAYVKLNTFQRHSAFYTWLYRIAINLGISWRRKQRQVISVDQRREDSGTEPTDPGERPEDRLLKAELAGEVQAAMSLLSDEHRAILVLREVDDCSYEEIAEILEVQVGTVRSRLHRARLQLRDRLLEQDAERRMGVIAPHDAPPDKEGAGYEN